MALTRKALAAMGIEPEKIDEIILAHTETVSALKEQIETLKADAGKLPDVEKKLADAEQKIKDADAAGWEKKYTDLKSEYDVYKTDIETKAAKTAKETAYKKLLMDAGVSEKRVGAVLKVTDLGSVKMNEDGSIQDADKITESVKTEWADFIETKQSRGAEVAQPPANNGGDVSKPVSRAAKMAAQFNAEHYGMKED
jgi:predicted  nucleic acid-binding Zn-ribbon protein